MLHAVYSQSGNSTAFQQALQVRRWTGGRPGAGGERRRAAGWAALLGAACVLHSRRRPDCPPAGPAPLPPPLRALSHLPQVYTDSTRYRLGRGYTGALTQLVVFNTTYEGAPGGGGGGPSNGRWCLEG